MKIGDLVKVKITGERVRIRCVELFEDNPGYGKFVVETEKPNKFLTLRHQEPRGNYRGHFTEDELLEVTD